MSEDLKEEIDKLKLELNNKEKIFSEKRAQFKELYLKKEEELGSMTEAYESALTESLRWKEETEKVKRNHEMDLERVEAEMLEAAKLVSQRHEEEARERDLLGRGESVLAKIAQRVRINTQEVMRIWKEEGVVQGQCEEDVLRSVVQPYEEDVQMLKDKIRQAYDRIDDLETQLQHKEVNNISLLTEKAKQLESPIHDHNNMLSLNAHKIKRAHGCTDNVQSATKDLINNDHFDDDTMKKSQSGNDLHDSEDFDTAYGSKDIRRNTDVQSLNEYCTNTFKSDDNCKKSRAVSENEWSRLHLELSALRNRSTGICELCKNYEDQLQSLQDKFKTQVNDYNELSEENQTNLRVIVGIRESNNKLACQLNEAVSTHEKSIMDLSDKYNNLNEFCDKLRAAYEKFRDRTDKELKHIVNERRDVKMKMEKIESAYEHLLGIRGKKAAEMEAEKIDLPTDIETAQFNLLTLKEEIIQTKSANEHLNERIQSIDIFSKEKLRADTAEKDAILEEYNKDRKEYESKIEYLSSELSKFKQTSKTSESLEETLHLLKVELETVKKNYSNLEKTNISLTKKSHALQQELENSESVQQDFVRLSQTLQIQLEKIRQEEKELRWQFKDDVTMCNDCQLDLQGNNYRNKYHCKHCGKVFCKSCLSEITVGANGRKADVCKVCHTMLVKEAAPYFSINKP